MKAIFRPIISEKAIAGNETGKYVFEVSRDANKHEIALLVEKNFKVEVVKVNICNIKSENRLFRGKFQIKTKPWKKAIVTLKKGTKLPGFEMK